MILNMKGTNMYSKITPDKTVCATSPHNAALDLKCNVQFIQNTEDFRILCYNRDELSECNFLKKHVQHD